MVRREIQVNVVMFGSVDDKRCEEMKRISMKGMRRLKY